MNKYNNHYNLFKHSSPEDVFCAYYSQFRKYIYSYLLELTRDSHLANDLTQNVFLKFWTLKDNYSGIGDGKAYLIRMAENAFRDACRQDRNRVSYIQSVSDEAEASQYLTRTLLDERELQRTFQQAILDLSGQRRIIFVLSKMEGWPREKIARTLGISPFTVKVTLQNALREVRKKCSLLYQFLLKQKQIK